MTKRTYKERAPNHVPRDFETEWLVDKPGQYPTQRFERLVSMNDTRQLTTFKTMTTPNNIPPPNVTTVFAIKQGKWQRMGYKCADCGKPMNDPEVVKKHPLICKNDKEINKRLEQEILDRVGKPAILPELPDDLLDEDY